MIDRSGKVWYIMNEEEKLQALYGSEIKPSKAVGYCKRHGCALTARTLKHKDCLKKQCRALEKYEDHSYWIERAVLKERKKMKKGAK